MKKFLFPIIVLSFMLFFVTPVEATEDTSVSQVLGATQEENTTTQEVTTTTTNSLKLTIPTQTDNPSTMITFVDPSTDKKGVQLETDSKSFVDITSPYNFPALSIGKHTLEFKYVDENGTTQIYDTYIIVIPRAPIISSPIVESKLIKISGTGLADSEVIILLSSGVNVISQTGIVNSEGKWAFEINREQTKDGVYSVNAYIRRYGYASNLSEITKFTIGDNDSTSITNSNGTFNLKNLTWASVLEYVKEKQIYIYIAVVSLLVGIFVGILISSGQRQKKEEKVVKTVQAKFTKVEPNKNEPTLKEKLMGGIHTSKVKEDKSEEPEVEEEKTLNKIDFLKDYKAFDPDDNSGKETPSKVDVSLTSKKENS